MKDLFYYPTFEPTNMSWLKYALIYLDKLSLVVPPRGYHELSDDFYSIVGEANLINLHGPTYNEANVASNKIISQLTDLNAITENNIPFVQYLYKQKNWRNKYEWDTKLYKEKYTDRFFDFSLDNGYGEKQDEDLICSREYAATYLSLLADEIALEKNASTVTDFEGNLDLTNHIRKLGKTKEINLANAIIQLIIPNTNEITFNKIINFRNSKETEQLRTSFNKELTKFLNELKENPSPESFIQNYDKASKEFFKYIGVYWGKKVLKFSPIVYFHYAYHLPMEVTSLETSIYGIELAYSADKYNIKYAQLKQRKETKQFITVLPKKLIS